jgi:Domain of unknown function (DUF4350)
MKSVNSMNPLTSLDGLPLDKKDRQMLLIIVGLLIALLVVVVVFTPAQDSTRNPLPSTYLSGQHGAKAAYTLLQQSGYSIERWEQPLSELADHAGTGTVLILAEPDTTSREDRHAIAAILRQGGRVLATGFNGGLLLPESSVTEAKGAEFAACEAQPEGLQPLAGPLAGSSANSSANSGPIWIVPRFTWKDTDPNARIAYTCAGQPVVVEYPIGQGHAVWWASSTPLENGSISRGQNMELLLNSVGPAQGQHVYWDESLHGRAHTPWDYVRGPVWPLLSFGTLALTLLVVLSHSRRSGPVRALPQPPRTTPIEFLDALGSLYRSTGAASTAMQIAWERFRTQSARLTGLTGPTSKSGQSSKSNSKLDARQITAAIERRYGVLARAMEPDLIAAEEASTDESLKPRRALQLVQALRRHEETLRNASTRGPAKSLIDSGVTLGV